LGEFLMGTAGTIGRTIIVVVGNLNPSILHPDWFDRHSLLPAEEIEGLFAEPIKKEIPEIGATIQFGSNFLVDQTQSLIKFKSFLLKCSRQKLEIVCEDKGKFNLLGSLVKKIFTILAETPINSYGINFQEHLKCSEELRAITSKLFTPNDILSDKFGKEAMFGHNVFAQLETAKLNFALDRSTLLEGAVHFKFNFHHENPTSDARNFVKQYDECFTYSYDFAEKIISTFAEEVLDRIPSIIKT
jgi:hypothetical protein